MCTNRRNLYQWKPWFLHQNKFCTKIRNYDFNLVTIIKISTKWDYGYAINSRYSSLFQLWPFLHSLERQPIITPSSPKALVRWLFITSSSWIWALRYFKGRGKGKEMGELVGLKKATPMIVLVSDVCVLTGSGWKNKTSGVQAGQFWMSDNEIHHIL